MEVLIGSDFRRVVKFHGCFNCRLCLPSPLVSIFSIRLRLNECVSSDFDSTCTYPQAEPEEKCDSENNALLTVKPHSHHQRQESSWLCISSF